MKKTIAIIGAGAAGYFGAINIARKLPNCHVYLLEATGSPLAKVKISGGGRCNVTHHCFTPAELICNYPRGSKELLGAFQRFQPTDTIAWFSKLGVRLKTEDDGRMFPVSNSSRTIIDCFQLEAARNRNLKVRFKEKVVSIEKSESNLFQIFTSSGVLLAHSVMLSTGSSSSGLKLAKQLGHSIVEPVPSLFTMKTDAPFISGLAGTSFSQAEVKLSVMARGKIHKFQALGPILVTHWGFSGPAILKLSAFGARALHGSKYKGELCINFLPEMNTEQAYSFLLGLKQSNEQKKSIGNVPLANLTKRAWLRLLELAEIPPSTTWQNVKNKLLLELAQKLTGLRIGIDGKSNFKEEFVTAGGVNRKEIDFRSMESKLMKGLFFAGEIVDIDGVTGGFNFQNAWTCSWIASETLQTRYSSRMNQHRTAIGT